MRRERGLMSWVVVTVRMHPGSTPRLDSIFAEMAQRSVRFNLRIACRGRVTNNIWVRIPWTVKAAKHSVVRVGHDSGERSAPNSPSHLLWWAFYSAGKYEVDNLAKNEILGMALQIY